MPVYAYRCKTCGVQFERVQRFSDDPVSVCPECAEATVTRIIHPAGIIFKGSGWYVKDSKAANPAGTPGKSKDMEGSGSASDKSDSASDKSDSASDKSDSASETVSTGSKKSKD